MRGNVAMASLYEFTSFDKGNIVVENIDTGNGKECYMKGIFIQGDVRNQNQRIYPLREISKAVKSMQQRIKSGFTIMGEADHPSELTINLDRVSHIIEDMSMVGSDGHGSLKIVDTPMGQIIKTLLKSGAKLGVSSRGSGNVGDDGTVEDYEIVTVDIVAQPSAAEAYPRAVYESLFNMKGGSAMFETARASQFDSSAKPFLERDVVNFIKELKL